MDSYFPHDSNARNDAKVIRVRMKYGMEGYGIYFAILERLRDEAGYMSVKDYNAVAFDLHVDAGLVKDIVENFGLFAFSDDSKCFYSESFNKRMEIKDAVKNKRAEAGKKGAAKRWDSKPIALPSQTDGNANGKNNFANSLATEIDSKERKGKETKVNKSKVNNIKDARDAAPADADVLTSNDAIQFYQQNIGQLAPIVVQQVIDWCKDLSVELVIEAMQRTAEAGNTWRYAQGILRNWEQHNITTMDAVRAADVEHDHKPKRGTYGRPQRVEPVPDWAKPDYKSPTGDMSAEGKAAIAAAKARLAASSQEAK